MTSGQKTAVSLLVTVFLFACFTVAAFAGLFSVIEARFYQPVKIAETRTFLDNAADGYDVYMRTLITRFSTYVVNPVVITYLEQQPADEDVRMRTKITSSLFSDTPGLQGLRLVDSNARSIHFSTFQKDILRSSERQKVYKNYGDTVTVSGNTELPVSRVITRTTGNGSRIESHVIFDGKEGRIIFSFPFYDSFTVYRGSFLFYLNADDLNRDLSSGGFVSVGSTCTLVADDTVNGFVFGLPFMGREILDKQLLEKWKTGATGPEKIVSINSGDYWLTISSLKSKYGAISGVYRNDYFLMPAQVRIMLLICVFVSLFLVVFLVLNVKHDDMVLIRNRIRKFQMALISEYLDKKTEVDWAVISRRIADRRQSISDEIRRSLGRKGQRHSVEVDKLLDKSWEEILDAIDVHTTHTAVSGNTAEIRRLLEEILAGGNIKIPAKPLPAGDEKSLKKAAKQLAEAEPEEEVPEAEAAEELTEAEPAEEVPEAEAAEELTEAEPAEEVPEAEAAEELAEAEPEEEVPEAEAAEELTEAEPAEEVPEAEAAEELTEAEPEEEVPEAEAAEKTDSRKLSDDNFTVTVPDFRYLDSLSYSPVKTETFYPEQGIKVPADEDIDEISPLGKEADREGFCFTALGTTTYNATNVTELMPAEPQIIVADSGGIIRVADNINTDNLPVNPDLRKLVESVRKKTLIKS